MIQDADEALSGWIERLIVEVPSGCVSYENMLRMRLLISEQRQDIADPVRSKFAMVVPVIEGTLFAMNEQRIIRLGGLAAWTLTDLAREYREGSGDAGICFEYAVHDAIATRNELIWPITSEVLEAFCAIPGGSDSLLFGPEKDGRIPVIESVANALTDDSQLFVGYRGRPPKLKRHLKTIVRAFRRPPDRDRLPRSMRGIWKADLFLGSRSDDNWVGTTLKINAAHLEGGPGLRVGIYPRTNDRDRPRKDDDLNLVRLPLPYDAAFMELFYKSFFLVKAFLQADAKVPPPVRLPDAEDRYITAELEARRDFPIVEVVDALRDMSQRDLLETAPVEDVPPTAAISVTEGLEDADDAPTSPEIVSVGPVAQVDE